MEVENPLLRLEQREEAEKRARYLENYLKAFICVLFALIALIAFLAIVIMVHIYETKKTLVDVVTLLKTLAVVVSSE